MKYFTESYLVEKYLPNDAILTPDNLVKLLHEILSDDDWDVLSKHGEIQKESERLEEQYIRTPASWFFTNQMYGRIKAMFSTRMLGLSAQELSIIHGISVDGIARIRYWMHEMCILHYRKYREMSMAQDKQAQENMISTLGIDEYVNLKRGLGIFCDFTWQDGKAHNLETYDIVHRYRLVFSNADDMVRHTYYGDTLFTAHQRMFMHYADFETVSNGMFDAVECYKDWDIEITREEGYYKHGLFHKVPETRTEGGK